MLEVLAPRLMIEKTIPRPQAAARALKHPSQCPALLARDGSPLAGPLTCRMRSGRSSFSWQRPPIGKWGRSPQRLGVADFTMRDSSPIVQTCLTISPRPVTLPRPRSVGGPGSVALADCVGSNRAFPG